MKYKAVCFDFDYTLGDATDAVVAGYTYALTQMGWPAPEREAVRRTIGYMLEDGYTMLTGDDDPQRRTQLRPLFRQAASDLQVRDTRLFPGAVELLRGLRDSGVKLAVISSKGTGTLRAILENRGVLELLDLVIGADAVAVHKPDPEGVLRALDTFGLEREQVLYCGDSLVDGQTAQNAGVDFCAVLNGTTVPADFDAAGLPRVHTSPDLWELAGWLEGWIRN